MSDDSDPTALRDLAAWYRRFDRASLNPLDLGGAASRLAAETTIERWQTL